jgi:transketolase
VTIVAAGITLHEALKAHARLEESGVSVRVIDAYCVKPIDQSTLRSAVEATGGRLVVAEDHWAEGGLGEAVLTALSLSTDVTNPAALQFIHLAVREMPGSGTPQNLLHAAGIDADHIVRAVQQLLQ